jgi:hypothetical protein
MNSKPRAMQEITANQPESTIRGESASQAIDLYW